MKITRKFLVFSIILFSVACQTKLPQVNFSVSNSLNLVRSQETVEIALTSLPKSLENIDKDKLAVQDQTGKILVSQLVDVDGDHTDDLLIFQSDFQPKETLQFTLVALGDKEENPSSDHTTYARFVPERTDDFAWENDRVAFRAYGPTAQQLNEAGDPAGTLSSGIDCWLKRVDYPIINKWYKQDLEQHLSYHKDHGEGLDSYHVGVSRGVGGIGIWDGEKLWTSKNYQTWKILANGPIRTVFELDYGTWEAGDGLVKEKKQISIDLGSNLFKCTLIGPAFDQLPNLTVGITLHDKKGDVKYDSLGGWLRYKEPMAGGDLSTAVVVDPAVLQDILDHRVEQPDQSHLLAICKPKDTFSYYAGFYWTRSKQFKSTVDFDHYLANVAQRNKAPLQVAFVD